MHCEGGTVIYSKSASSTCIVICTRNNYIHPNPVIQMPVLNQVNANFWSNLLATLAIQLWEFCTILILLQSNPVLLLSETILFIACFNYWTCLTLLLFSVLSLTRSLLSQNRHLRIQAVYLSRELHHYFTLVYQIRDYFSFKYYIAALMIMKSKHTLVSWVVYQFKVCYYCCWNLFCIRLLVVC